MNVSNASAALYKAFEKLNKHYFKGVLPEPMIVIVPLAKQNAFGMFYFDKLWMNEDKTIQKYEIGIASEALNRPYLEVIQTLLHELIHLYCKVKDIKDTKKKGKYHKVEFKEQCEKHGMTFEMTEPHDKLGWFKPVLTDDAKAVIESFKLDPESFKLARMILEKKKKVRTVFKYECPGCELKLRLRKEANLKCLDCDMKLLGEGEEPDDETEEDKGDE